MDGLGNAMAELFKVLLVCFCVLIGLIIGGGIGWGLAWYGLYDALIAIPACAGIGGIIGWIFAEFFWLKTS